MFFLLTTNGLRCLLSVLLFVTTLATVGKQHHRTMFDHPQSIIFFSFAEWQPSVDASHQLRGFVDEKNEDIRLLISNCCYTGEATEMIARVTVMHFSAGSLNCTSSAAFSGSTLFSSRSGTHCWLGRRKNSQTWQQRVKKKQRKGDKWFAFRLISSDVSRQCFDQHHLLLVSGIISSNLF